MYRVLGKKPHESHFYPECTKQHTVCYADKKYEQFTEVSDAMKDEIMSYSGLLVPLDEFELPDLSDESHVQMFLTRAESEHGQAPDNPFDANTGSTLKLDPAKIAEFKKHPSQSRKRGFNAYTDNMPMYEQCMKLVTCKEDQELATRFFNEFQRSLYERKRGKTNDVREKVDCGSYNEVS